MKLDWDEYQACIRILAKRAGVSLTTDVAVGGSERFVCLHAWLQSFSYKI